MKGFWRLLPSTLCNDATFATPADDRSACWNGRTIGKYTKMLVGDGTANQADNPEVNVSRIVNQSTIGIVTDQMLKLRIATNRMKRAYEGRSVDKGM